MGKQFKQLSSEFEAFISQQKMFFVGSATADSKVNISPKGMDSLRVLSPNRVVWLNVTGSGNETAAHIQEHPRMTVMFCAFEGRPLILRLYGQAKVVHHNDPEWAELYSQFEPLAGARQIFDLNIEMVQGSCGMSVPFFDYQGERDALKQWAEKKGPEGVAAYWEKNNQVSLDGQPSHIVAKNIG